MKGEALKGHLDSLLLAVLARGPQHGYAVIERLRDRSRESFVLPEGTVYPALHRLEARGLLSSRWTVHEGRRRRLYELTARGRTELSRRRNEWVVFASSVARVLGTT